MKLFENIKEFFFSDEEDDNDQADMPNVRSERSHSQNGSIDYDEQKK